MSELREWPIRLLLTYENNVLDTTVRMRWTEPPEALYWRDRIFLRRQDQGGRATYGYPRSADSLPWEVERD